MKYVALTLILILTCSLAASAATPQELLTKGIQSYQNKEYTAASQQFREALEQDSNNHAILFNLGLSEIKNSNFGQASAYLRKCLEVSPGFKPAKQALDYALSKLSSPQVTPDMESLEYVQFHILRDFNPHILYAAHLFLLLMTLIILVKYLGKRKTAFEEELPMPMLPYQLVVALVFLLILSSAVVLKILDSRLVRGTIVAPSTQLFTGPGDDNSSLFEVFSGTEVVVKNKAPNWYQVYIPGGQTGWISSTALFITSKEKP